MSRMHRMTHDAIDMIDQTGLEVPPMISGLLQQFRGITESTMAAVYADRGTRGHQPEDFAFAPRGSRPPPRGQVEPQAQRRRVAQAAPAAPAAQPPPSPPPPESPAAPESPAPPPLQSPRPFVEPFTPLGSQFRIGGTSTSGPGESSTSQLAPTGPGDHSTSHEAPTAPGDCSTSPAAPADDPTQPDTQDMGGVT